MPGQRQRRSVKGGNDGATATGMSRRVGLAGGKRGTRLNRALELVVCTVRAWRRRASGHPSNLTRTRGGNDGSGEGLQRRIPDRPIEPAPTPLPEGGVHRRSLVFGGQGLFELALKRSHDEGGEALSDQHDRAVRESAALSHAMIVREPLAGVGCVAQRIDGR